MAMNKTIAVLPGDGIGPEVTAAAKAVIETVGDQFGHTFSFTETAIGGAAIDEHETPLPDETVAVCEDADAILLGAVGGPRWDGNPSHLRPEKGLLGIRKALGLFANLRPVTAYGQLLHASPLKKERVAGSDMLIVRELTGGLYFGEPSERQENGQSVVDTLAYQRYEIERIVEKAFECARIRGKKLTSVDKANVLESSRLWREIVDEKAANYPDVSVDHLLVDAAAMKLVQDPAAFDVIVAENLFGDILSDEASVLTGSLGMLPSASLRADGLGLYEPVHGSAPDIAGKDQANPLAMILSAAMMLRYSLGMEKEAVAVETAVQEVLAAGYHTGDLATTSGKQVGTKEMSQQVIECLLSHDATFGILSTYS